MANVVMFCILAVVIIGSAIMCVTTKRIMRAATYLLFVLFGVAGIYFLLDYTFLGAAQIAVYNVVHLCNTACVKADVTRIPRAFEVLTNYHWSACCTCRVSSCSCYFIKE